MGGRRGALREARGRYGGLLVALATMAALFYPAGLAHELGHLSAGWAAGSECEFFWELVVVCDPVPRPVEPYHAMGGVFGAAAAISLAASGRVRARGYVLAGVIGVAADNGIKAVIETAAHAAYLTNEPFRMLTGALPVLLVLALVARRRHMETAGAAPA